MAVSSLTSYQNILANLESILAEETLYEATHGPKPDYNLDGESYQFSAWTEAMFRKITACRGLINAAQPFIVTSRGRLGSRPSP